MTLVNLVFSLILTLALACVDIAFKNLQKIYVYILMFIVILIGMILFHSNAHADEHEYTYHSLREMRMEYYLVAVSRKLSAVDRQLYKEKMQTHLKEGERTYQEAKDKCWYLPNLRDRDNARYCYQAAAALCVPTTPMYRLIAVLLSVMSNYGLDCIEEWHYINTKLYWSQYHYELADFYEGLLNEADKTP